MKKVINLISVISILLFVIGSTLNYAQDNFWFKTNGPTLTTAIAYDVNDNIYTASNGKGIWKSTDHGLTWTNLNNGLPLNGTQTIAVVNNEILLAGCYYNKGVYRSTNLGQTWNLVGLTNIETIYDFQILDGGKILCATSAGIYYSNDSGLSWYPTSFTRYTYFIYKNQDNLLYCGTFLSGLWYSNDKGVTWVQTGYNDGIVRDMAVQSNVFFIATSRGIKKSTNNGGNWNDANNGINNRDIYQFVVQSGDIYAATNDYGIVKSSNNGDYWFEVNTGLPNYVKAINVLSMDKIGYLYISDVNGNGFYRSINPIIIPPILTKPELNSPANGSTNISLSPTLIWNRVSNATSYRLQVSTNFNFTTTVFDQSSIISTSKLISGLMNNTTYYWRVNATDGNLNSDWSEVWSFTTQKDISVKWQSTNWPIQNLGIQAIATNKQNHVFVCTATDGIYRTTDLGNTWIKLNSGLAFNNIASISIDEFERIFIGTHGDGVYFSNNNGDSWSKIGLGTIHVIKIFALNNYVFAGDGFNCTGVYRTSNLGSSWTNVQNGLGVCTGNVIITKNGLVFGGSGIEGMYKSTNYGNSWQQINTGLTSTNIATMVADNFGNIFVGTQTNIYTGMQGKGVFKTTNNGISWQNLTNGITTNEISQLALSSNGVVFTSGAGNQAIFKSTNSGNTWNQINQGLPNPADIGPIGITISGYVFAAVNNKIFKYFDQTTDIKDKHPDISTKYSLSQNYPNPFNPSTTIQFSIPHSQFVNLKVYDNLGREVATLVNEEKLPGNYEIKFDGSNLPCGVYFYRLQAGSYSQAKKLLLLK